MSKAQKFNYLMASLDGKAAAEIERLQFCAEKNYDHAVQLLLGAYGRHDKSVDLHMNELLHIQKVKSIKDIEDLRRLFQAVQVNMLALESLDVKPEGYAPMLIPVLKSAIPAELSVEFKLKELSQNIRNREGEERQQNESTAVKKERSSTNPIA